MAMYNLMRDLLPHEEAGEGKKPHDPYSDLIGTNIFGEIDWEAVGKSAATCDQVNKVVEAGMNRSGKRARRAMRKQAREMAEELTCAFNTYCISSLARLVEVISPQVFTGVFIREEDYQMLRQVAREAHSKGLSLVLLPSHKSHIDYMAVHYLMHRCGISLPAVAAGDNLNIPLVGQILRNSGAYFIRRSFGGSDGALYSAVVSGFMDALLQRGVNVEFFPEGGRSRTGKLLQPKVGLLGNVLSAVVEERVADAVLLPISVQYDRLMESTEYARELLGAKKQKESVTGLVGQVQNLLTVHNPHGGIHVRFASPFSAKEYVAQYIERKPNWNPKDVMQRIGLYKSAAYKVMDDINNTSVATPTAVVATVLLTTRGRGVGREELIQNSEWLKAEIERNRGNVCWPKEVPTSDIVDTALGVLGGLVSVQTLLEPIYSVANHLELSFYRNSLVHVFVEQAIVACSLHSFMRNETGRRYVTRKELIERAGVLSNLLKSEFVFSGKVKMPDIASASSSPDSVSSPSSESALEANFRSAADQMVAKGTLVLDEADRDKILLFSTDPELWSSDFTFLCMLLWPFIESYWLCLAGIIGVFSNRAEPNIRKQRALAQQLVKQETFVEQLQAFGMTLFHLGNLNFYESVSKESLRHALQTYTDMGAVQVRVVEDVTRTSARYIELGSNMKADISRLFQLEEQVRVLRRKGKFQKDHETHPERLAVIAFSNTSKL